MSQKVRIKSPDLNEIVEAWSSSLKMKFSKDEAKLIKAMYPPLAQGKPLAPADVATNSGFPVEMIEKTFRLMKRSGAEFDESGNLIGNALTLKPTDHKFVVGGQELYA